LEIVIAPGKQARVSQTPAHPDAVTALPARPAGGTVRVAGVDLVVRPIAATDGPELAAAFERLSEQTRYQRFFTGKRRLSGAELTRLTVVDHHDHEALVAVQPGTGRIVAVARFIRSVRQPEAAEIAVTVADEWQRRGLGGALVRRLAERARDEGLMRFTADVLTGNRAVFALLRRLGSARRLLEGSTTAISVDLVAELDAAA
jgi:RimJ/RimL family protein N-acetyltransferase